MKNITFKVFSPGGNTTALVYSSVPAAKRAKIAQKIMSAHSDVEQVGFVSQKNGWLVLNMMGGEFCANAARCCVFDSLKNKSAMSVKLRVSGFPKMLKGSRNKNQVSLVLPGSFLRKITQVKQGHLVDLRGISFLLTSLPVKDFNYKKLIQRQAHKSPATGVVRYAKARNGKYSITPWVWVPLTHSLVQETACGSGSIALAWLINSLTGNSNFKVIQPTGSEFKIILSGLKNNIKEVRFRGKVKALPSRKIWI